MSLRSPSPRSDLPDWSTYNYKIRNDESKEVHAMVGQLLQAGAAIHLTESVITIIDDASFHNSDQKGRSALHLAAAQGYTETAHLLIEHGANVNWQDKV